MSASRSTTPAGGVSGVTEATCAIAPAHAWLPVVRLAEGPLQAIKWLALASMTVDHVNKYLFNGAYSWAFGFGRLAMPLFALVLAYNLARSEVVAGGTRVYYSTAKRLAVVGIVATIPFIGAGQVAGGWWPANIMFKRATASAMLGLAAAGHRGAAAVLGLLAGPFVEFFWPALVLIVAAHAYFRRPSLAALVSVLVAFIGIGLVNQTQIGIVALGVLGAATAMNFSLPRCRRTFYAFYPVHLACLWVAQSLMSQQFP